MFQPGTQCFYLHQDKICPAIILSSDGVNDAGKQLYTLLLHDSQRKLPCCIEQDIFFNHAAAAHALRMIQHHNMVQLQSNMTDLKSILRFAITHDLSGTDKQARLAFMLAAKQILNIDLTKD